MRYPRLSREAWDALNNAYRESEEQVKARFDKELRDKRLAQIYAKCARVQDLETERMV
jgi:hypothetical protein